MALVDDADVLVDDPAVTVGGLPVLKTPTPTRRQTVFDFETEVTFSDTTVKTFPTSSYDRWTVWADLDGESA